MDGKGERKKSKQITSGNEPRSSEKQKTVTTSTMSANTTTVSCLLKRLMNQSMDWSFLKLFKKGGKKHEKPTKRKREESGDGDEVATEEDKDGADGKEVKKSKKKKKKKAKKDKKPDESTENVQETISDDQNEVKEDEKDEVEEVKEDEVHKVVDDSEYHACFKMGRSTWRQIFVIQAASFQTPLASEVSLTSHMLKVAKLFQQPKQSLILSFEKVNVDDGADKSLSRIAVQPVTQLKAPTDLKPKKKKIPLLPNQSTRTKCSGGIEGIWFRVFGGYYIDQIMNEIDQKNKAALVTPESPFDTKS
ncbi:hypothetical protein Tco_0294805 [Tanacetum coccineum]